jgi:hypothetical protein
VYRTYDILQIDSSVKDDYIMLSGRLGIGQDLHLMNMYNNQDNAFSLCLAYHFEANRTCPMHLGIKYLYDDFVIFVAN